MEETRSQKLNKDLILRERLAIERTIMTNNTTLLAFIRTSLYFVVAGLSLHNLLTISYGLAIEIACWIIASVILMTGLYNYQRQKKKLKESEKHIGDYKMEYERQG